MYYGPTHVPGPNDRTMIQCPRCGWVSPEMTRAEVEELGQPRYCGNPGCEGRATRFVTYAPHERPEAFLFMMAGPSSKEDETRALIARNRLRWDIIQHASNPENWGTQKKGQTEA